VPDSRSKIEVVGIIRNITERGRDFFYEREGRRNGTERLQSKGANEIRKEGTRGEVARPC